MKRIVFLLMILLLLQGCSATTGNDDGFESKYASAYWNAHITLFNSILKLESDPTDPYQELIMDMWFNIMLGTIDPAEEPDRLWDSLGPFIQALQMGVVLRLDVHHLETIGQGELSQPFDLPEYTQILDAREEMLQRSPGDSDSVFVLCYYSSTLLNKDEVQPDSAHHVLLARIDRAQMNIADTIDWVYS